MKKTIKIINLSKLYKDVLQKGQYSVREIAGLTMVSKSVISDIVNVVYRDYSLETIIKICVWLDKPVDDYIRKEYKNAISSIQSAVEI